MSLQPESFPKKVKTLQDQKDDDDLLAEVELVREAALEEINDKLAKANRAYQFVEHLPGAFRSAKRKVSRELSDLYGSLFPPNKKQSKSSSRPRRPFTRRTVSAPKRRVQFLSQPSRSRARSYKRKQYKKRPRKLRRKRTSSRRR